MTAIVNPNNISCACHSGPLRYGALSQPAYCAVQRPTDDAAKMLTRR
jgi:hypothetical protein